MAGLVAMPAIAQDDQAARCTAATVQQALGGTSLTARWVEADADAKLPAYCEISTFLSAAPGSSIGVVYRLPAGWNGKLLGIGGGGWAGNVTLGAARDGLMQGYATAQTDGGHPSTEIWNNSWANSPEPAKDFAYRAINLMTVSGKAVVKAYYGRPHARAYYAGCSTGGRMGLMEAQRFPEDYDAIVVGAPVYSLQVQTSAVLRNNSFARGAFSKAKLGLVNGAVLKACDAADGTADGVIAEPRRCRWKPQALACKQGQQGDACLSPAQIATLNNAYDGMRSSDGAWAQFPLSKGGELGWPGFISVDGSGNNPASSGGIAGLTRLLFGERAVDYARLDPLKDVPEARASAFAAMYEATNPDLSAFFKRGGKLILWHGESDPGPSPVGSLDYAEAVRARNPGAASAMRAYMLPGVEHCRGGPGADLVDWLGALDTWVEDGNAATTLVATNRERGTTRPVCVWPQVARYAGSGDASVAASWRCEAGAR